MKKILLSITCFSVSMLSVNAQILYGITANGGGQNMGTISTFEPATNTLTVKKNFQNSQGANPSGALLLASNGKLYGTTIFGGSCKLGTIYSFDPSTSVYKTLMNFNSATGTMPKCSLIQAKNGKLYGLTEAGGDHNNGVIFSFDITSSTYTKLYDFDGTNGAHPFGSLLEASDGKLYGMTNLGGAANLGVLFSFDPATSTYAKRWEFITRTGVKPYGSLIETPNGALHGMTSSGGIFNAGTLFTFYPASSIYSDRMDFTIYAPNNYFDKGAYPFGTITKVANGNIYGMTTSGGSSNQGTIFAWNPFYGSLIKLKDFSGADGVHPYGQLFLASDEKLYGLTREGGANNLGVIFSYDPITLTYKKLVDLNGTNGANSFWNSGFIELVKNTDSHTKWFRDADGDGYGDLYAYRYSATQPEGYVKNSCDCGDHKTDEVIDRELVRMCHNGIAGCVQAKEINTKLAEGFTLGLCPASGPAITPGSVTGGGQVIPQQYKVSNWPNPFIGRSTIKYELPFDSKVSIKVYDLMGGVVATLVDGDKKAGNYTIDFNASGLSNGSLYYRIIATSKNNEFEQTNKMIRLK